MEHAYIDTVIRKASKRMFVLRNLRRSNCPTDILHRTYVALIRSVLLYSYPALCNMPTYLLNKIVGIEKRAFRVCGSPMTENFTQAADSVCRKLFQKVHDKQEHPLRELFLHRKPTKRNSCALRPPLTKTKRLKNSFIRHCPSWSSLDLDILIYLHFTLFLHPRCQRLPYRL